jgi:integrase
MLDAAKYAELFPNSTKANQALDNTFGAYAQIWLDSRNIVKGTRDNYKTILNTWLMPYLATKHLNSITTPFLRKLLLDIPWSTMQVKTNAMTKLGTIFKSAVQDGILTKNPMDGLELPKKAKKKIDPFSQQEADQIIEALYKNKNWAMRTYGAFFEFSFYTGMRPGEIMALRWDEVDLIKKRVFVCRIVAECQVVERTKTNKTRYVLLNARALQALAYAKQHCVEKAARPDGHDEYPYCFPPAKGGQFISVTNLLHTNWREILDGLGIRYRPPYNARHTYATMCLMAGMNPAFIANQLGHSVEMLLSTYAHWLSTEGDWSQMDKLVLGTRMPQGTE